MITLGRAVGRTCGENTHVYLCTRDTFLSFPEFFVYWILILCNNNQHPALRVHLDRCYSTGKLCPVQGPLVQPYLLPPWCDNPGPQSLWTIHNHLLTCERTQIIPEADTQWTLALEILILGRHWIKILPCELTATKHQSPARHPSSLGSAWEVILKALLPGPRKCCLQCQCYEISLRNQVWCGVDNSPSSRQAQGQPDLYWILKCHKSGDQDMYIIGCNDSSYCPLSMFQVPCPGLIIFHMSFTITPKHSHYLGYTDGMLRPREVK